MKPATNKSKTLRKVAGAFSSALLPKLRFPEFRDVGKWEEQRLGDLASICTERVGKRQCVAMSVTSGVGLVSQQEKFGRMIAGGQFKNYVLLRKGDFAYNKSATREFPQGYIAMYTGEDLAAVPNSIFTCFQIKGDSLNREYINYLFAGNLHGRWLRKFITIGARAHGSLNIDDDDILSIPIPLPFGKSSSSEQQKIADCLISVDDLMTAHKRKLAALKDHKKGLMQQLFPREGETQPRLRFPEFQGKGRWDKQELGTIADPVFERANNHKENKNLTLSAEHGLILQNEYFGKRIAGVNAERYLKIHRHDFVYNDRATKTFAYGTIKRPIKYPHGIISPIYKCFRFVAPQEPGFWEQYFEAGSHDAQMKGLANEGARTGRFNISIDRFLATIVKAPKTQEQQKISNCLSTLNNLITAQIKNIETLQQHKKGLMQQLFPDPELSKK